jgi:hypothetical protein
MLARKLAAFAFLASASACASSHQQVVPGASEEQPARNRDRNLITQGDLEADPTLKSLSVLDVVRSLRPQYLTSRGTQTIVDASAPVSQDPEAGLVHASVNAGRIVQVTDLADIHGNDLVEVRYLNVAQAMQRFGTAARQGPIILVMTAKQP